MRTRTRASGVAVLALTALALAAPAAALTGRQVIEDAQKKNGFSTWRDRTLGAHMDSYSGSALARTREVDITEQTDPHGEHRTFMHFTGPADVQGTLFLHLSPRGERDKQWLWTPQARRVRRLAEAQEDENFFGSDLTYRDLELLVRIQQWTDGESTATLEPAEGTVDGKPCHVVTLVPKNDEFPYTRYRLWYGTGDLLLWQVDVFDKDEKTPVKRVTPRRYARIGDYETAIESDVATPAADTHTYFTLRNVKYDTGVSDEVFGLANISKVQ